MKVCKWAVTMLVGFPMTTIAQHRLLPTDVLERGETEWELRALKSSSTASFRLEPPNAAFGSVVRDVNEITAIAAAGLGSGWELGASLPYSLRDRERDVSSTKRFFAIATGP